MIDIRKTSFIGGHELPVLGQGTWGMAEDPGRRSDEIAALRRGLELGLTLIDTAEMYADGGAEELLAEALGPRRDTAFIVSKAYPQNASATRLPLACERSLARLGTDRIDLYLLHWRGGVPLAETVAAMQVLVEQGKIRAWGVSNLDTSDMAELIEAGGGACATDQILYNLTRRGPEYDLLPWLAERDIPVMAYSPIEQGALLRNTALAMLAKTRGITTAQLSLAWLLRHKSLIAIPKTGHVTRVEENLGALSIELDPDLIAALDQAFPGPRCKRPLEML